MRRSADALAQNVQQNEMLRQREQALTQQVETARRSTLLELMVASRRKPIKRHHIDENEVRAHEQAVRAERRDLHSLESIGPAQLLCKALDEMADEMIEDAVEQVAEGVMESLDDVAGTVINEVDEVVGEMADDFIHLIHLD